MVMVREPSSPATTPPLGEYLGCSTSDIDYALRREAAEGADHASRIGGALLASGRVSRDELVAGLQAQRIDRLRACKLFEGLDDLEFQRLSRCVTETSIAANETFIEQGAINNYLYVLAAGKLEVYRVDDDGEEIHLAIVLPGEPIGEMAYFSNGVRSACVRTLANCQLLQLDFSHLPVLFDTIPRLTQAFLGMVTHRLRQSNLLYEENQYRVKAAQRSLSQLNQFLDLSDASALGVGIEGLIKRLVHMASSLMDADRASLFLIDPVTGELWSKVAEGAGVKEIRIPAGAGVAGWVAQHRAMVNIQDAYTDDRFNQAIDNKTGYRTRTILCGPVNSLDGATTIGVVQVINKRVGVFTAADETLFKAFSHQAAVAVENFSLYRKMVASHQRMSILLDIATSISQTLDLGALISRTVALLTQLIRCERSSFFLLDEERGELWSMEAHGSDLKEIRFPATAGLAGHAVTYGEVVNVADAYEDDRFNAKFDQQSGFKTHSVLCVPVPTYDGKVTGVVQVINKEGGATFDAEDVELLQAIASQLAITVENGKLHAEAVNMRNYLESVQQSISNGIITLDEHYRLVTANRSALEILHFDGDVDSIRGHDFRVLMGKQNNAVIDILDAVYAHRRSTVQFNVVILLDEQESTANINVLPLADADDVFQGLVIVIEDVTSETRIKSALTRYMAQDIVERMLADPSQQALGGVRSAATVLFTDIRKFTSISEQLTAEETMDMLNEYFTLMVEEVFDEHGVLDKFIGDSLMAVFGVPYPQDDDAIRAVRTALKMTDALRRFNESWTNKGHDPIAIGIGINSDEVISGNMGSEKRMDYTVIGDGVNVASRLEGLNKQYGTTVLISDKTRKQLGDEFVLRCIDHVVLKGKTKAMPVYEVLGMKGYQPNAAERAFTDGFDAYLRQDFDAATKIFAAHVEHDPPSGVFAARCAALRDDPPAADWNGAWTVRDK